MMSAKEFIAVLWHFLLRGPTVTKRYSHLAYLDSVFDNSRPTYLSFRLWNPIVMELLNIIEDTPNYGTVLTQKMKISFPIIARGLSERQLNFTTE